MSQLGIVSQPLEYCVATPGLPPIMIQAIVSRLTLAARSSERVTARPAGRPVVSWPIAGHFMGSRRRAVGHIMALCCTPLPCPVSRYNLLYREPNWKMGSNPSNVLQVFSSIFFLIPSVASLLLPKCSSLDNCNLYN